MWSCLVPSTSGAVGSGVERRSGQVEHSWSYTEWLLTGFCPGWRDLAERKCREDNTSGAHNRPGTHSPALVLCDTQLAESYR